MAQKQQQKPVRGKKETGSSKRTAEQARQESQKALVEEMIQKMKEKLTSGEMKPSVGDLIRLLQLEKELEEEQPREIRVSWVEPCEEGDANKT
ncbi:MAG: hypothetical protein FJW34_05985 [Acidobacteria bacterium]|nr:hypothetical protein [Acidobacteriota bacterium]